MSRKLEYEELIQLVDIVLNPMGRGFSSEEINQQLLLFCTQCPDPVAALDILLEARRPAMVNQVVDDALARPRRSVADVPVSELPLTHPLRKMHQQREPM